MLLIWGEDLEPKEPAAGERSRLIAAFLSPQENELWRHEGERLVGYVWRSSAVQLQSDLAIANHGGMSVHVGFGAPESRLDGTAVEQSTTIIINMRQGLVEIMGLGTRPEDPTVLHGTAQRAAEISDQSVENENVLRMSDVTSTLRMRLTDLKCYRLPGESSKITSWP